MLKKLQVLGASLLALAIGFAEKFVTTMDKVLFGPDTIRARTCDVAYGYRMPAGFPGDINRMHPASVVPGMPNVTTPPRLIGDPVKVDTATNSYRGFAAGDQHDSNLTSLHGVTVRSYPTQQSTGGMASAFGTAVPQAGVPLDFLVSGFIMVKIPAGQTVTKNGAVFVWCSASTGAHVLGGFEGALDAGDTVAISNARFTGPADADGIVEIEVWPARA